MASNPLNPFGFAVANLYGAAPANYATRSAKIAYNNANTIAWGDPVKLLSSGYIDLMATGGSTIHGIFRGCTYLNTATAQILFTPYWNAPSLNSSVVVEAYVDTDPNLTFRVQVNGGPVVQGDIGSNIDITSGSSGQPTYAGFSTCSVAFSTIATTSTLPFRILGIIQNGTNTVSQYNPANANNIIEVAMNTSDFTSRTGI